MAQDEAKLFVRGLADSITDGILRQIFEETGGNVVHVSVPKDRETGRPRGIAFVTMGTPEEAKTARETLDGSIHGGRSISVRPYEALPPRRDGVPGGPPGAAGPGGPGSIGPRSSRDMGQDRTLYVGNLPYDVAQADIEELIGQHAPNAIQRVHLPVGPDGRRRGFGFVTMASIEAAKQALDGLQGAELANRKLVINLAQPKADRPARPEGGFNGGGAQFAPPPPPPGPASRKFGNDRKKATGSFDDGGPPRRGGGGATGGAKKGRERETDWRRGGDPDDD